MYQTQLLSTQHLSPHAYITKVVTMRSRLLLAAVYRCGNRFREAKQLA